MSNFDTHPMYLIKDAISTLIYADINNSNKKFENPLNEYEMLMLENARHVLADLRNMWDKRIEKDKK